MQLPVQFEGELELAGVEGSGRLASGAGGGDQGVAKLVNRGNVGVVEEVEGVRDQIEAKTFAEADALGDAEIELEEIGHGELVAAEVTRAAERRSDAGNREGLLGVGEADSRRPEDNSRDKGRGRCAGGSRHGERRPNLGRAKVEASVFTGDDIERPAGGKFDQRSKGEVAQEALHEGVASSMR